MRDEKVSPNVLDGFVIVDGTCPQALAPALQATLKLIPHKVSPEGRSIHEYLRELESSLSSILQGAWEHGGSINRTMFYLIISHDDNHASVTMEDDKPILRYPGISRSDRVKRLDGILAKATNLVGGTFEQNPFIGRILGQKEFTVHPLGGASMSSDGTGEKGVTNHIGQVLKGCGREVHDGLVVVDGAVIPSALGVHPFATITALAERSVEAAAREKGWHIDYHSKNGFPVGLLLIIRSNKLGETEKGLAIAQEVKQTFSTAI
jgi:choline dehydrogenase-like flavoprotein